MAALALLLPPLLLTLLLALGRYEERMLGTSRTPPDEGRSRRHLRLVRDPESGTSHDSTAVPGRTGAGGRGRHAA